jgi:hypothetical protein
MGSRDGLTLRQRALEALERSTRMLQVAIDLLEQGNSVESERVRKEAQTQRAISTLLMAEAHNLEKHPVSIGLNRDTRTVTPRTLHSRGH